MKILLSFLALVFSHYVFAQAVNDTATINHLIHSSTKFLDENKFDSCISNAIKADSLANGIQYKEAIAEAELLIGYAYLNLRGDYISAEKHFHETVKICNEITHPTTLFKALTALGYINENGDNPINCISYYQSSLKAAEASGEQTAIALAHRNIGVAQAYNDNWERAVLEYNEALHIAESIKDTPEIIKCNFNIGIYYDGNGINDHKLARNYQLKAIGLAEAIHDTLAMALSYNELRGDYLLKGFDILRNTDYWDVKAKNYDQMIEYFDKKGQTDLALKLAESILDIAKKTNSFIHYELAYSRLSFVYLRKGDYKNAYNNSNLQLGYKDSIYNEKKSMHSKLAAAEYETEKNKQEVAINQEQLRREKLIRNSMMGGAGILSLSFITSFIFYRRKRDSEQRRQVSEMEMKALRAQMNPHFIFNSLQSIQTFLHQQKSENAETYLIKFSKLMRLVLENSQHTEVPLTEDLRALELYMQLESLRLKHPFTYTIRVDEEIDKEYTLIPPLILQPFVENAIWHGLQHKDESGHINIYIRKQNSSMLYSVEDNGVGRRTGKELRPAITMKKESLGLKLTEERLKLISDMKKMRAYFKITDLFSPDSQPNGTLVELLIPVEA